MDDIRLSGAYVDVKAKLDTRSLDRQMQTMANKFQSQMQTALSGKHLGGVAAGKELYSLSAGIKNVGNELDKTHGKFSRFSGAMSRVSSVAGGMKNAIGGIAHHMSGASRAVSNFSRQIGLTAFQMGIFGSLVTKYITIPVGVAVAAMVGLGVKGAANIEVIANSIKHLLPAGTNLEATFARLKKFSLDSPNLSLEQTLTLFKQLIAAGVSPHMAEQVEQNLDRIISAYGVSGDGVQRVVTAISQSFSKGKLQSEELTQQLGEQAPMLHALAQAYGVTDSQFLNLVRDGKITTDVFAKLLIKVGSSKQVMEAAAGASDTLWGRWQRFKDNFLFKLESGFLNDKFEIKPEVKSILDQITPILLSIADAFAKKTPEYLNRIKDFLQTDLPKFKAWWDGMDPTAKEILVKGFFFAAASGPAAQAISAMGSGINAIMGSLAFFLNPAGLILLGLAALAVGFVIAYNKSKDFKQFIDGFINGFKDGFDKYVKPALADLSKAFDDLKKSGEDLAHALGFKDLPEMGRWFGDKFAQALAATIGWWAFLIRIISAFISTTAASINAIKGLINWFSNFGSHMAAVGHWFMGVWTAVKNWFINLWTSVAKWISDRWHEILNTIGSVTRSISAIWQGLVDTIKGKFGEAKDWLLQKLTDVKNAFVNIFNTIKNFVHDRISDVRSYLSGLIGHFGVVRGKAQELHDKFVSVFNGIKNIIGGAFDEAKRRAIDGINRVGDVIWTMIDNINKVLGKVGVKLPQISKPLIGSSAAPAARVTSTRARNIAKNRAGGGPIVGPGTGTSDSIPATTNTGDHYRLSNGEWIIRAKAVKALGARTMNQINHADKWTDATGRAGGGRVGGGNNGLLEEHRNHVHVAMAGPPMSFPQIIAAAKLSGIPFTVGSTFRPGSRAGNGNLDHHSEGRAVDFPGYNQDRLASYFEHLRGVIELIHRSNSRDYAIFGGKASVGGSGGFGGLFGLLWNVVKGGVNKLIDPAIGKLGGMGFPGEIAAAGIKALKSKMESFVNGAAGGAGFAGAPVGKLQQYAKGLLGAFGWGGDQFGPLQKLWEGESGWNPNAVNPSSGAYGIPQALGKGHPYNLGDGPAQIRWGLKYIKDRYGSPGAAWNFWNKQSPHWYDNGGIVPEGDTLVRNRTGQGELMLNPAQAEALRARIAGDANGDTYVTVKVGDEIIVDRVRAERDAEHAAIATLFRAGKRD